MNQRPLRTRRIRSDAEMLVARGMRALSLQQLTRDATSAQHAGNVAMATPGAMLVERRAEAPRPRHLASLPPTDFLERPRKPRFVTDQPVLASRAPGRDAQRGSGECARPQKALNGYRTFARMTARMCWGFPAKQPVWGPSSLFLKYVLTREGPPPTYSTPRDGSNASHGP